MIHLRYMTLKDIPQIVAIDREAFTMPWSARSYAYEVAESTYSYMLTIEQLEALPLHGWKRLIRTFNGDELPRKDKRRIVAYGGLWNVLDEAHISTIASHTEWRGQGFGEIALAAMIRRSIMLNVSYIVLEVRVSNKIAQNLYRKYGFESVDVKVGYYRDDNEDAYDMRLELANPHVRDEFEARFQALKARYDLIDDYTEKSPPRANPQT